MIITLKLIVDIIYRTQSKRRKFEKQNNEKVLAADASKGIIVKYNDEIKRNANWIVSQRAVIFLTEKKIYCGKWDIPIDKISNVTLVKIKSIFGSGQVLKIDTIENEKYQFGMQVNDEWINQDILKLNIEIGNVKTSLFSWTIRIVAFGYLIYYLIEKFGG